ncbi:MAG: YggS family pyridoxal phosphate-dependent enzyme [Novosphingobium sp.]|nr:YggS family pyridoxal phosphate-dependent enzyme [Novosphingobium sp.]MCC2096065.1 YggS family pyridoxal phosphate-dependent enzyme [Hyphomicrobiales bacterium]
MNDLTHGLEQVLAQIADAAHAAGRDRDQVELTVASKTQPAERIRPLLLAGQRIFGENRVQEAQAKWPQLKAEFPGVELHMIGPLQSNKAEHAIQLFDVIETVDRISLVKALAKGVKKLGKRPKFYAEINIGREPQKAGVAPEEADSFIATCRNTHGLEIEGLMCIPPEGQPAAPFFAHLAQIAKRNEIKILSMGMSADYEVAIAEGATHVRVGTAVFGHRL